MYEMYEKNVFLTSHISAVNSVNIGCDGKTPVVGAAKDHVFFLPFCFTTFET